MTTDWLTAIGTIALAFATVVLAIIAAFQDKIRAWLMRPKLSISIATASPDCQKTIYYVRTATDQDELDCYYFRLRVKNSPGNQRAELVEVIAAELSEQQADGKFKKMESFLPMNLRWSHIGKPFRDAISPGTEKHCDLGHILKPAERARYGIGKGEDNPKLPAGKTIFSLDLEVIPSNMAHLIPPGTYRLVLQVAAANINKPVEKTLEIVLTGNWYDDESEMLGKGIGIREP